MEGKLLVLNNAELFLEGEDDFPLKSLEGEKGGVGSISATSSAIVGMRKKTIVKPFSRRNELLVSCMHHSSTSNHYE
uniref:Uncharacterized protein n=1 Tax=Cucumis melo TaxID=3656 RepID=A0A9I9EKT5_CUCME